MTREQLEAKTVAELRQMCVYNHEITGMSKKRKDVIIDAIIEKVGVSTPASIEKPVSKEISGLDGEFTSVLTTPSAPHGQRITTTIRVSCGASTGQFNVEGRTVGAVAEFLREVLNIDRLASGIVNGKQVEDSHVLKTGDTLEYLKPAGRKGC